MSVTAKVFAAAALALAGLAAALAATAAFFSWSAALLIWTAGLGGLVVAGLAAPLRGAGLEPCPGLRPRAGPPPPLNPLCHPVLLPGRTETGRVVVLLHGISSCPRAFVDLAPELHARGHAVIAPRLPCNGHADRATDALRRLTAEKLCAFADRVVDDAASRGGEVVVCGISAGGTVAAWIGQFRPEVARVVLVAPFLGLPHLGPAGNLVLTRAMLALPEVSLWKDPVLRARFEGMPHAYKRQSSHGTAEVMRLGRFVLDAAREQRPAAGAATFVLNDNDAAIDNGLARRLADRWAGAGMPVARHVFARDHGLGHEIIDPLEPGADPALTYPVLVRLIEGGTP